MRNGIVVHEYVIDDSNACELAGMDFVFLCIDEGAAKRIVVEQLEALDLPFVDVGMGVDLTDGALGGIVRATSAFPDAVSTSAAECPSVMQTRRMNTTRTSR